MTILDDRPDHVGEASPKLERQAERHESWRGFLHAVPAYVYLIVFFVLTVVAFTTVSSVSASRYQLADTAIRLAVFFYAGEFLSSRQKGTRPFLPVAAVVSLLILAARGLA